MDNVDLSEPKHRWLNKHQAPLSTEAKLFPDLMPDEDELYDNFADMSEPEAAASCSSSDWEAVPDLAEMDRLDKHKLDTNNPARKAKRPWVVSTDWNTRRSFYYNVNTGETESGHPLDYIRPEIEAMERKPSDEDLRLKVENSLKGDSTDALEMRTESQEPFSPLMLAEANLRCPTESDITPTTTSNEADAKRERMRLMSLEEFVSSERSYVKSLELIVNVFVDRIHTDATDAHVRLLFNNAAHIYTVNTSFLKDLEARLEDWKKDNSNGQHNGNMLTITDIIREHAPLLRFYERYSTNLGMAMKVISSNKKEHAPVQKLLVALENDERLKGETIESLLIKPIQRIPRYILLVGGMQKYTDKDTPEAKALKENRETLEAIAENLNNGIRSREEGRNLMRLQQSLGKKANLFSSGRYIIRSGTLSKVSRSGQLVKMNWYLFNDLVIAGRSSPLGGGMYKQRVFDLEDVSVGAARQDLAEFENSFQIQAPKKTYLVCAASEAERDGWYKDFERAIKVLHDKKGVYVNLATPASHHRMETAPVWTPKTLHQSCALCSSEFTIMLRKHHCSMCGSVVCNSCSPSRQIIPHLNSKKKKRVCNHCLANPPRYPVVSEKVKRSFSEQSISSVDSAPSPVNDDGTTRKLRLQSFSTGNTTSKQESPLIRPKAIKRAQSAIRSSISSRQDIAAEIWRSEKAFSAECLVTLEVIVRPLLARLMSVDSPSINPDMAAAFDTLEQLSTLSRKTQADLRSLLDEWNPDTSIADVFLRKAPLLTLYEQYAGYVNEARKAIAAPEIADAIKEQEDDPRCEGVGLDRRLLWPIKRLKIYSFMLDKLMECEEKGSDEFERVKRAIEIIQNCSHDMGAAMSRGCCHDKLVEIEAELRGRVDLVAPGRVFIRSGRADCFSEKVPLNMLKAPPRLNKRRIYLFSDRIVIAKKNPLGVRICEDFRLRDFHELVADPEADEMFSNFAEFKDDNSFASVIRLKSTVDPSITFSFLVREPTPSKSWFRDVQKYIQLNCIKGLL